MSILLRKGEEKMKKKILFLVAAFALFVPSVLAAEPTLEDKNFFANGTSITVTDRTDGVEGALIKWEGGEQLVPATINIFGGSHNSDEKNNHYKYNYRRWNYA
jgi:hypothetical protein